MNSKRLYRNESEKMIAGVCSGLGDYMGLDPTVMRLIFILLFIMGGQGLLVYLILWLIMPLAPKETTN